MIAIYFIRNKYWFDLVIFLLCIIKKYLNKCIKNLENLIIIAPKILSKYNFYIVSNTYKNFNFFQVNVIELK